MFSFSFVYGRIEYTQVTTMGICAGFIGRIIYHLGYADGLFVLSAASGGMQQLHIYYLIVRDVYYNMILYIMLLNQRA